MVVSSVKESGAKVIVSAVIPAPPRPFWKEKQTSDINFKLRSRNVPSAFIIHS